MKKFTLIAAVITVVCSYAGTLVYPKVPVLALLPAAALIGVVTAGLITLAWPSKKENNDKSKEGK